MPRPQVIPANSPPTAAVPASVSPDVGTTGYTDLEPRIRATLTGQKASCARFAGV
jgi:hypothetical protein